MTGIKIWLNPRLKNLEIHAGNLLTINLKDREEISKLVKNLKELKIEWCRELKSQIDLNEFPKLVKLHITNSPGNNRQLNDLRNDIGQQQYNNRKI